MPFMPVRQDEFLVLSTCIVSVMVHEIRSGWPSSAHLCFHVKQGQQVKMGERMCINTRGSASLSGSSSLALMVMDGPLSVTQISVFSCSSHIWLSWNLMERSWICTKRNVNAAEERCENCCSCRQDSKLQLLPLHFCKQGSFSQHFHFVSNWKITLWKRWRSSCEGLKTVASSGRRRWRDLRSPAPHRR